MSKRTGAPVPTIKFYLRERLLPPGKSTGRNQAEYDERHVRRVRLIRTLTGIGELELASVRELLSAIDDEQASVSAVYRALGRIRRARDPELPAADSAEVARIESTRAEVDAFVDKLGWRTPLSGSGRETLVHALVCLRDLGCDSPIDFLLVFAQVAERAAVAELDLPPPSSDVSPKARALVWGVLLEAALVALHRMAFEHHVVLRHPEPEDDGFRSPTR